ncbi:MAG TPA: radical SAM family heme chaperone HemW [Candidatus Polarisedimenticolia bacterium]|nr:radical SAM family heme chaperone HemW [Candidatus Polarisedimenticolia bacterium]
MASSDPLGLYLHVPFCTSHCTYCDFFTQSYPGTEGVRGFASALAAEIGASAAALGMRGARVDTVYVGGGTPSLLAPPDLEAILGAAASAFRIEAHAEITIEANPESVTQEKLVAFRSLGVNRLSLGVQSFQERILETLGRAHSPQDAVRAVEAARGAGFASVSLDLMLALPGQDAANLREDLRTALDLAPDHLSAYLLEMDKETALRSRIERGDLRPPTEDEAADLYEITAETLAGAGLQHYEISSFARHGARCRHNLKYWTDRPFLGCGPSAWSYLAGRRFRVARNLEAYLESARQGVPPVWEEDPVSPRMRLAEAIFAGLRLMEGIDVEPVSRAHGIDDPLRGARPRLEELEAAGVLERRGTRLRLTSRGYSVANEVFAAFLE